MLARDGSIILRPCPVSLNSCLLPESAVFLSCRKKNRSFQNPVYTQRFNARHRRVGHVFQSCYEAILVEPVSYPLALCRYVVLNPVRAGMVRHAGQ